MSQENFWVLLSKRLSGEASLAELKDLENLILEHPEWQYAIQNLEDLWKHQQPKDEMEAEDALLTAFTKILDRIDQYKNEGSFEGWIRKVMVNESLSYLRKNKSMYVETDIEAVDKEPNYEKLENQLEAQDLLKLISELPSGYRIVFNMFAIDGYSHKEISEQLGINENTSKSQLSRARSVLQKKLLALDEVGVKEFKENDI